LSAYLILKSPGSSVSIVTLVRAGRRGCDSRQGQRFILLVTASRLTLGPTQPPIQWVPGALSLGLKRPGRETDHSFPFSAEVKSAWSYTSTIPFVFVAWCLVKYRGQLSWAYSLLIRGGAVIKFYFCNWPSRVKHRAMIILLLNKELVWTTFCYADCTVTALKYESRYNSTVAVKLNLRLIWRSFAPREQIQIKVKVKLS
jgi:hypothetical protein